MRQPTGSQSSSSTVLVHAPSLSPVTVLAVFHNYEILSPGNHLWKGLAGKYQSFTVSINDMHAIVSFDITQAFIRRTAAFRNKKPDNILCQFKGCDTGVILRRTGGNNMLVSKAILFPGSDEASVGLVTQIRIPCDLL
jgi:hypothetical protein